jgi:uncharacterized damage-inducible protein DinB
MPAAILTVKPEEQWSIQEHVGHLIHTETLLAARLDDYDAGADTLTPPGIPGKKSEQSRHNEKPIKTILENLRQAREMQIKRLEALQPEDFGRTAFHPRLKVPMRLVDTMYFFAEHDDYHLARARETALALIG